MLTTNLYLYTHFHTHNIIFHQTEYRILDQNTVVYIFNLHAYFVQHSYVFEPDDLAYIIL